MLAPAALLVLAATLTQGVQAVQVTGLFIPEQAPTFGVGADGNAGTLTINGNTYPLPPELNPVSATTIALSPGGGLVTSHRTPEITDTCSGQAVQHMYHEIPATPGQPLPLIRTVCLAQPRAFQGLYEQPGISTQRVAVLREVAAPTSLDQRLSFVRLDTVPGVSGSQLFTADVESVRFSPSGTVALVKYDLPGGNVNPADYRFVDLCPATFGQTLADFPDVGADATAAVEGDGSGGFQVRFSHPGFAGGATTFAIADCLGAPPPPPPGQQRLVVTLAGNGSGRVSSTPAGIDCPNAACQASYPQSTAVTLQAIADQGSSFTGWSGDCSGTTSPVSVTLDVDRSCEATFSRPAADLAMTCSAPSPTVAGDRWLQQYTVVNNGPDPASSTSLVVTPDAGLTFDPQGSTSTCGADFSGNAFCNLTNLEVGSPATLDVAFTVDPLARGSASTSAVYSSGVYDPDAGNGTCQLTATLDVEVELSLSKSAAPDPVGPGELVVYTLEVSNSGLSGATDVQVTDVLPPEVTQVLPATTGSCDVGPVLGSSRVASTIVARVGDTVLPGTQISNSASVTAAETESTLADNSDSETVTVGQPSPRPGGFVLLEREFQDSLLDFSVPAQSGPYTAYFAQDSEEGVFLNLGGQRIEVHGSGRAVPGRAGQYVNIGIGQGPTLDGFSQAWFGQYTGLGSLVAQGGDCAVRELFDERVLAMGSARPDDWLLLTEIRLANGRLAFSSSRERSPLVAIRNTSGSFETVADGTTSLPGTQGGVLMQAVRGLAFNGTQVAFHAGSGSGCSATSNGCDYEGLFLGSGAGISLIADTNTPVPNGSGTFGGFMWFAGQLSMDGTDVVFLGYDSQRRYGLYLFDGSSLTELVGPATPVPGGSEPFDFLGVVQVGEFDFPSSAPAVKNGTVAFVGGSNAAQRRGLYLWRDGGLTTLVEVDGLINGDRVDDLRIGPEALGGDTLAFFALVADGQSAGSDGAIILAGVNTDIVFASGFE